VLNATAGPGRAFFVIAAKRLENFAREKYAYIRRRSPIRRARCVLSRALQNWTAFKFSRGRKQLRVPSPACAKHQSPGAAGRFDTITSPVYRHQTPARTRECTYCLGATSAPKTRSSILGVVRRWIPRPPAHSCLRELAIGSGVWAFSSPIFQFHPSGGCHPMLSGVQGFVHRGRTKSHRVCRINCVGHCRTLRAEFAGSIDREFPDIAWTMNTASFAAVRRDWGWPSPDAWRATGPLHLAKATGDQSRSSGWAARAKHQQPVLADGEMPDLPRHTGEHCRGGISNPQRSQRRLASSSRAVFASE